MSIEKLYPKIQYPVSRGTPMIAPLITWNHDTNWHVSKIQSTQNASESSYTIKLSSSEHSYIEGHTIDGRVLYPATGYLCLVWNTFANMRGKLMKNCDIEFVDVRFLRGTFMKEESGVTFYVAIHRGSGRFEISENFSVVVTGFVRDLKVNSSQLRTINPPKQNVPILKTSDFYKELKVRGFHYNGEFRSVIEARADGLAAKIKWNENFVTLMDCLMQMSIISFDFRTLALPVGIDYVRINTKLFEESIQYNEDGYFVNAYVNPKLQLNFVGGIEIQAFKANAVERRKPPGEPVLERYRFVPYFPKEKYELVDAMRIIVQLELEMSLNLKIKAVEVETQNKDSLLSILQDCLVDLPLITSELILLKNDASVTDEGQVVEGINIENSTLSNHKDCTFVISSNVELLGQAKEACAKNGLVILRNQEYVLEDPSLNVVSTLTTNCGQTLIILKLKEVKPDPTVINVSLNDQEYSWLENLKKSYAIGPLCLLSQGEPFNGIVGLVNCLRKEPEINAVCFFIDDKNAPIFDLKNPFYRTQFGYGLPMNVYRNGEWGSYKHLTIPVDNEPKPRETHFYANTLCKGDLSSFAWIKGELNMNKDLDKDIIEVHYAALNFKDVMLATGKLNVSQLLDTRIGNECDLGLEYSGYNRNGERVMGIVGHGAMATYVEAYPGLVWKVPDHWTMAEAVSVPAVYITVYHAFFYTTKIQRGKKILIHGGAGGIGLSSIRVALANGLEVFTTVSTPEKKEFVLSVFPQIPESHVGHSRDNSFYDTVMFETKGVGVDYVLNSLAEEKLIVSMKCLGENGHFLEIGKYDMMNDTKIGMDLFKKNIRFSPVLIDRIVTDNAKDEIMVCFFIALLFFLKCY